MLVAGNKVDIAADRSALEALRTMWRAWACPSMRSPPPPSSTRELMYAAARELEHLPPITVYEPTYVERPPEVDMSEPLEITHEDDTWLVEGPWLQRSWPTSTSGTTSPETGLTGCFASPACLTGWRRWEFRTGTSSPSITWNSSTSGKAERRSATDRPLC